MGFYPVSLAVGDFNGDGILDLATANYIGSNVSVLLGNGSGGFTAAAGSPFSAGLPYSVAVADFNNDGNPDLIIANENGYNATILLGSGAGGFTSPAGSPFAAGLGPFSVVVGDFNGDGFPDFATANEYGGNVTVMLGNGAGGFSAATGSPFAVGSSPVSLVVGDFNGDGIPDLATANSGSNNVTVLLGNGSGGFTAAAISPLGAGTSPSSLVVRDFNGDGIEDLAIANSGSNNVTVLLGAAVGATAQTITFAPLSNVVYEISPYTISATASSGLPVSFASATPAICTVAGSTVTILGGGTCSIVASQAGNATYAAAPTVLRSFTVNPGPQTIVFPQPNSVSLSTPPFSPNATASSGLTVTFTSSTPTICIASGIYVSLISPGTCTITANQTGNVNYGAAPTVMQSFTVTSGSAQPLIIYSTFGPGLTFSNNGWFIGSNQQAISAPFTPAANFTFLGAKVAVGSGSFDVVLQADSGGLPGTVIEQITVAGANGYTVVTARSTLLPLLNRGTQYWLSVIAGAAGVSSGWESNSIGVLGFATTQSGSSAGPWYSNSVSATPALEVDGLSPTGSTAQTITFNALSNLPLGATPPALSASTTSGLTILFTSNSPSVCTVSGTTVSLVAQGTCSITASQSGNATYAPAASVTQTFMVLPPAPVVNSVTPFSTLVSRASSHRRRSELRHRLDSHVHASGRFANHHNAQPDPGRADRRDDSRHAAHFGGNGGDRGDRRQRNSLEPGPLLHPAVLDFECHA